MYLANNVMDAPVTSFDGGARAAVPCHSCLCYAFIGFKNFPGYSTASTTANYT